jgi:hypothetical protein
MRWGLWDMIQSGSEQNTCEVSYIHSSVFNATFIFCLIYILSYYDMFRPSSGICESCWNCFTLCSILYHTSILDANFLNYLFLEMIKSSLKVC